jgi:hypothetical protein
MLPSHIFFPAHTGIGLDVDQLQGGFVPQQPNIYSFLRQQFAQTILEISNHDIDQIEAFCLSPDPGATAENMLLLAGSTRIVNWERDIGLADTNFNGQVIRYGLRRLIDKICQRRNIDYCLLDFGPSASALNMTWLASCDFVLPPCFPDYYNLASLHGLLYSVYPNMLELRDRMLQNQPERLQALLGGVDVPEQIVEELKFRPEPPKLMFTIVSNYKQKIYKNFPAPNNKFICVGPSKWIVSFGALFQRQDIPARVRALFVPSGRGTPNESMVVPIAQTFNQTQQLSHELGYPVPMLTENSLRDVAGLTQLLRNQHIAIKNTCLGNFRSLAMFLQDPNLV